MQKKHEQRHGGSRLSGTKNETGMPVESQAHLPIRVGNKFGYKKHELNNGQK
jgi:hypothetical protein